MLDNHTPHEHRPEIAGEPRHTPAPRVSDREVPIRRQPRTPAAVHAWLDGDLPEAAVRSGDTAKQVEFWKELNSEADKRRHMRTPPHVYQQIMDSLPQTTPRIITPWWRRQFAMTPALAFALATGILILGAVATMFILRAK